MSKFTLFEIDQEVYKKDFGNIVLYRRPDHKTPRWNCRIQIHGSTGYVRKSCRSTDKEVSIRFADDLYKSLVVKQQITGDIHTKSFPKVVTEFLKNAKYMNISAPAIKEYKDRLTNYPVRFWKDKSIDQIQRLDITKFIQWRRTNGIRKNASGTTIRRELGQLKRVFKFAYDQGYISKLIEFPIINAKANPRPHFTKSEYNKLTKNFLPAWIRDAEKNHPQVHRERYYLQQNILILANSGCRIGELRELRWNNIEKIAWEGNEDGICFWVTGKTGKRQVIPQQIVKDYLARIHKYRTEELGHEPDKTEHVFSHPDGEKIHSFKKGFRALLVNYGLLKDQDGNHHTLYSLRHTYAVFRISEEVNQYLLATNMGTSVQMLHNHYLKLTPETHAAEITKTRKKRKIGAKS